MTLSEHDPERLAEVRHELIQEAIKAASDYLNSRHLNCLDAMPWAEMLQDADFGYQGIEAEIHAWTAFGPETHAQKMLLNKLTHHAAERELSRRDEGAYSEEQDRKRRQE